jgi:hypothetical protein
MFTQILVGVNEHEGGRDGIALARNLLAPGGEVTLAYVHAGDPHIYRSASAAYDAAEHERARELLEKTREQAPIEAGAALYRITLGWAWPGRTRRARRVGHGF